MPEQKPQRKEVWSSQGSPEIKVLAEHVQHNGHQWLQHIVQADDGAVGAVAVATFEGKFLLVEHYRPATGATLLEFPRGFGDTPNLELSTQEQGCADGSRELLEETGIESRAARVLGHIWADSGLLGNKIAVVAMEADTQDPTHPRDGEIDRHIWCSASEMSAAMVSGKICDGITMSAYALWCAARAG